MGFAIKTNSKETAVLASSSIFMFNLLKTSMILIIWGNNRNLTEDYGSCSS